MFNIILYDPQPIRNQLLPLTFTRPVALLRHGIMTFLEKWQHALPADYSFLTEDYLEGKYPLKCTGNDVYIPGNVVPEAEIIDRIKAGEFRTPDNYELFKKYAPIENIWEIFTRNDEAIKRDFDVLTAQRKSQPLSPTNHVIGDPEKVFLEPGARCECANLNVNDGPIYIGRDAEIMEGASLRGPIALCEHAVVKLGSKIYGATTLGPHCKAGGEVNNVVFTGYSNKAHDGFLGNAVLGEWCNLGAGCTASNLKNTYGKVRLWSYITRRFERTDLQFCGLIMGDHSKAGINTMFNTATTIGVGVNFYGPGFPRTYLPSFTQGTPKGMDEQTLKQVEETAQAMMARRGLELTDEDCAILAHVKSLGI